MIKRYFCYILAMFICLSMILMYLTIVLIPLCLTLQDYFDWWKDPFYTAWERSQ